jgi:hypothetical protein
MIRAPMLVHGRRAVLAIAALAALSCQHKASNTPPPPPSTQAPSPADAKPVRVLVLAFAGFKNDDLVECDELDVPQPTKPGADIKGGADQLWASFKKPKDPSVTMVRVQRSCAEQFPDRKPFGVCADSVLLKSMPALHARVAHFSFANVFRSDWAMRECLEEGGSWSAMSRTSDEFHEAQLRFDTLDAQRQMKKLLHQVE